MNLLHNIHRKALVNQTNSAAYCRYLYRTMSKNTSKALYYSEFSNIKSLKLNSSTKKTTTTITSSPVYNKKIRSMLSICIQTHQNCLYLLHLFYLLFAFPCFIYQAMLCLQRYPFLSILCSIQKDGLD